MTVEPISSPTRQQNAMIHVAGILDLAEARLLIECGFRYLGFPLGLDYHAEDLPADAAARIVARLGDQATFFVITYHATADAILDLCEQVVVAMVQLHGTVSPEELAALRKAAPDLRIIKSLVVGAESEAALTRSVAVAAPFVDAFITDTFDPATGAKGATGKTHDWAVSRRLVNLSPRPVILAGGLTPANVAEAVTSVGAAGVDVHTGIEDGDGRKNAVLARAFVDAALKALDKNASAAC
jgi:phosphoribosylanthranilate isomerase